MAGARLACDCIRATVDCCSTSLFQAMLQYVRQELMKAGLSDEHADAFLSKLRRSIIARPDAGLADFHELCCCLKIKEEEVCSQPR